MCKRKTALNGQRNRRLTADHIPIDTAASLSFQQQHGLQDISIGEWLFYIFVVKSENTRVELIDLNVRSKLSQIPGNSKEGMSQMMRNEMFRRGNAAIYSLNHPG
jgi:hypothetical protein